MRKDPVKMTKIISFTDCAIDLPRDGISNDCEFDRDDFIDFLLGLSFIFVESTRHGMRRSMTKLRMTVKATGAKNPIASSH